MIYIIHFASLPYGLPILALLFDAAFRRRAR